MATYMSSPKAVPALSSVPPPALSTVGAPWPPAHSLTAGMSKALDWVQEKGGALVETPLAGAKTLKIRCAKGHEWQPRVGHLAHSHSWCPMCYGNVAHTIEDMRQLAKSRGGDCLSDTYLGLMRHLTWACSEGHRWDATPNNVKCHGSWCPHCTTNIGEEITRAALSEAFPGETFDRTRRVAWMQGLELDGYNEKLRLAFEYQGIQHAARVAHFQRDESAFEAQQERDALTAARCEAAGVYLLEVPHTVKFVEIRKFVRACLEKANFAIAPVVLDDRKFYDSVRARGGTESARRYSRLLAVVQQKGGVCLSRQCLGIKAPVEIRCGQGHVFTTTLEAIDQPEDRGTRFCPVCGGTQRKEDEELAGLVESCGFEFLDGKSVRDTASRLRRYIRVRCPQGHEYEVLWDNFRPTVDPKTGMAAPKKGCADCHHAKLGAAKAAAPMNLWSAKSGIAPKGEYPGKDLDCLWVCSAGHEFTAKFRNLRARAQPCAECKRAGPAALAAVGSATALATAGLPPGSTAARIAAIVSHKLAASSGITPIAAVASLNTICTWKCTVGHEFTAKLCDLRSVKVPCLQCEHLARASSDDDGGAAP